MRMFSGLGIPVIGLHRLVEGLPIDGQAVQELEFGKDAHDHVDLSLLEQVNIQRLETRQSRQGDNGCFKVINLNIGQIDIRD